jgi:hypothetical protein
VIRIYCSDGTTWRREKIMPAEDGALVAYDGDEKSPKHSLVLASGHWLYAEELDD